MSCTALDDRLDDYCDGALPAAERAELEAHVAGCTDCTALVAREDAFRRQLAAWGDATVPLPDDTWFDARLADASARGRLEGRRRWLTTAVGGLLAAGIAALLIVTTPPKVPGPGLPNVTMTVATPRTVNLVFASAAPLEGATVTLLLPPGVDLEGFPGQREVSWQVSLAAGRNLLPLTLVGHAPQSAELEAILSHNDDSRRFRLRLSVT